MGTSYAVETAQHCHNVLLLRAGCLRSNEQAIYQHPLPKGPGFDFLCIDDHVYLLIVGAACQDPIAGMSSCSPNLVVCTPRQASF